MTTLKAILAALGLLGVLVWRLLANSGKEADRLRQQLQDALARAAGARAAQAQAEAQAEYDKEVTDAQAEHDAATDGDVADWVDDQLGR